MTQSQSLLIVTGHPRSGTTLLYEVCNSHPDFFLTYEFGNFIGLKRPREDHQAHIQKRFWPTRPHRRLPYADLTKNYLRSFLFGVGYVRLSRYFARTHTDNLMALKQTLSTLKSGKRIVGDKYPRYVFFLDEILAHDDVKCVVIYRDCRDVVASVQNRTQGAWQGLKWAENHFESVATTTERWVKAIETMEVHRDRCHVIRYEALVENPSDVMSELGDWLQIDPEGFDTRSIHAQSIGRYRQQLSADEIAIIEDIAGSALGRLGYME